MKDVSDEEIERLRKYIGKKVDVTIYVDRGECDYGEMRHQRDYDFSRILLTGVDKEGVSGIYNEEPEEKSKLTKILFRDFIKGFVAWDAGTNRDICIIRCSGEILFQRDFE